MVDHFLLHCEFSHGSVGSFLNVWDSMGDAKNGRLPSVWMAELVGETFLSPPMRKKKIYIYIYISTPIKRPRPPL